MYSAGDKVKVIAGKYEGAEGIILGRMNETLLVKIRRGTVYINRNHVEKIK